MKLSLYELQKQFSGRLMWGVLALLMVLNMALCYYFTDTRTDETLLSAMQKADEVYREDPRGVTERYNIYKELYDDYEAAFNDWFMNPTNDDGTRNQPPEYPDIPSTYYEGWDDFSLIDAYFERTLTDEEYRDIITESLDTAERTVTSYKVNGYDTNAFAYRYQIRYIETYRDVLENVNIKGGYDYGWDILFAYSGTGLFIFLAIVFVGSRIYLTERDCGMHLVLRATRNGRDKQVLAKTVAAGLLSIIITLLFFTSSMLVIGWKVGFSEFTASVQQISSMVYSPYEMNMLTALIAIMALTALAAFALCLLTACFSLLTRRSLFAMLLSAVVVGLSYVFANHTEFDFLKYVNIFTASSGETLLGQWRAVHLFTHPVGQIAPLTFLLVGLFMISSLVGWGMWSETGVGVLQAKQSRLRAKLSELAEKLPRLHLRSLHLFPYEWQKMLPAKLALLCVALVALKLFLSVGTFSGELTYNEELKRLYMEQYESMTLQESFDAVNEKLAYYEKISAESYIEDMAVKSINGEISYEEYSEYRNELSEAMTYKKTLAGFGQELGYLLDKEAETGINTKPVFSSGVRTLLSSDFEPILVILLMLLFCGSYAKEYETGFKLLLHSTKKGRTPVFFTKLAFVLGISIVGSLGFTLIDSALVFAHYDMSCVSAPLFAIQSYSHTASSITIGSYLILVTALRTFAYTLLGLLIASLSGVFRSEWSAAGVTLLLFIPYLLKGIGLTIFEPIDLTVTLSADRLYLLSTASGEGGSMWLLAIVIAVWAAMAVLLTAYSKKKFCK